MPDHENAAQTSEPVAHNVIDIPLLFFSFSYFKSF